MIYIYGKARLFKKTLFASLIALFIGMLLPSKQAIYMMAGASAVTTLTQTPEMAKVRTIINLGLDKTINNLPY